MVGHLNSDVVTNVFLRHIVKIVTYFLPILLIIAQIIPLEPVPKSFSPPWAVLVQVTSLIIVALAVSAMVASVVAHLNPSAVANAVWRHIVTIVSYFLPILFIIAPKISQKIRPTMTLKWPKRLT